MSDSCIFCRIIAGQAEGSFVYADELTLAFLDINQPNDYKVLVVPRRHAEMIWDLTPTEATHLFPVAVRIARTIQRLTGCEGMNVFQANGVVAGQEVFHFHLHLLPRYNNDGHKHSRSQRRVLPRAELDRLAEHLRTALADSLD